MSSNIQKQLIFVEEILKHIKNHTDILITTRQDDVSIVEDIYTSLHNYEAILKSDKCLENLLIQD